MSVQTRSKVLIIDDERALLTQLEVMLLQTGSFAVECLDDSRHALERIAEFHPDVLVLDMAMPHMSGEAVLEALRELPRPPEVIVLSGVDDVELAVRAMKLGAYDYIAKPVETEELFAALERATQRHDLKSEVQNLRSEASGEAFAEIITRAPKMRRLLDYVEGVAPSDNPVLIWGDSGTGKELIARAIHRLSKRRDGPFVAVNAGVFADELFASEFFGHIKGAFSGATGDKPGLLEQVNGGTLFLDEVGELELSIQVKLLRVLQEGEFFRVGSPRSRRVDVRLITATNKDLQEQIERGYFRTDLFYRLNVCTVFVPPLRERDGDVPLLAQYFVEKYARAHGKEIHSISDEVLGLLERYVYPGNVRELENVINSGVLIESSLELTRRSLPQYFLDATLRSRFHIADAHHKSIAEVEREHIERVLQHTGGNRTLAAKILRISRTSLINKIKSYKLRL